MAISRPHFLAALEAWRDSMVVSGSTVLSEDAEEDASATLPTATKGARRDALAERIKAMIEDGMSYRTVVAKLNEENEPTLSGRGQWQGGTIKNLVG